MIKNGIIESLKLKVSLDELKKNEILNGYKFYIIEDAIQNRNDLFEAFYKNCEFPDWFGSNWNALYDCLTDYDFAPANGYIFRLVHYTQIHEALGENDWGTFIKCFTDACSRWEKEGKLFCLILG